MREYCQGLFGLGVLLHFTATAATFAVSNTSAVSLGSFQQALPEDSVELSVGQGTDVDFVGIGSNVTFLVSVYNGGPAVATGVTLTNAIPPGVTFVSVTSSQGACGHSGGVVTCALGDITEGAAADVAVTLKTSAGGSLTNVVGVVANEVDRFVTDNVNRFAIMVGLADLNVQLLSSADHLFVGQLVTNIIVVTNRGPDAADVVSVYVDAVTALVPIAVECEMCEPSPFGDGFFWSQLASHSSRSVKIVHRPIAAGEFVTRAYVISATPDPPDPPAQATMLVEPGSGLIYFDDVDLSVREDAGAAFLRVVRWGGTIGEVTVTYHVSGGSADVNLDFVPPSGSLTFADGEALKILEVPIVADGIEECNEDFSVRLLSVSGGANLHFATNASVLIVETNSRPSGLVSLVSASSIRPDATGDGASEDGLSGSSDGRFAAFTSYASDLLPDFDVEQSGLGNIFVRDLWAGRSVLASPVHGTTNVGAGECSFPILSADGRCVVYFSEATSLVDGMGTDGGRNIYLRNLASQTTKLISVNRDDNGGVSGYAFDAVVSSNGMIVVFAAFATNLAGGDILPGYGEQLYVRDVANETTSLVTVSQDGASAANGPTYGLAMTPDGRFIAFSSMADNLVANDTNHLFDVFVRDLEAHATTLVTENESGVPSGVGLGSAGISLSSDGRYLAFESWATDLAPNTPTGQRNIFVRDLVAGVTRRASVLPPGLANSYADCVSPRLTPDGRFLAFIARSTSRGNPSYDVFVRDLAGEATVMANVNCRGNPPSEGAFYGIRISDDGRFVVFESAASGLVPGQGLNPGVQLYRRDLLGGTTTLLSQNYSMTGWANSDAVHPWVTGDGKTVIFGSGADDLVPGDDNSAFDIFVWREGLPPSLEIRLSDGFLTLQWPSSPAGFRLEVANGLDPEPDWQPYEGLISDNGANMTATISTPSAASNHFFRLRRL